MDLGQVKQIVETIKTLNLNIDSVTAQKAVSDIADKVGVYLILRIALEFVLYGSLILGSFIIFLKIINALRDADKENLIRRGLGGLDLSDKEQRDTYERIMISLSQKK